MNTTMTTMLGVLFGAMLLLSSGCDAGDSPCVRTDGSTVEVGDSFALDACNTCTCLDNGKFECAATNCTTTCTYNGLTHGVGDTFADTDGCNTCTCEADGSVSCTEIACTETCDYGGATHDVGSTFDSTDGCNTCTCEAGGTVACTAAACKSTCEYGGMFYDEGDVYPQGDGCNDCTCNADGSSACTKRACIVTCSDDMTCTESADSCLPIGAFAGCGNCDTPDSGDVCTGDGDCEATEICESRAEDCTCGGEKLCHLKCSTDGNCAVGEECKADGRCGAASCPCPESFRCDAGGCLRLTCTADSDCAGTAPACIGGRCYPEPGTCSPPVP